MMLTKKDRRFMRRMYRRASPLFRDCFKTVSTPRRVFGEDVLMPFIPANRRRFESWAWRRGMKAKKAAILARCERV